tara:strand:+ start:22625 stop:24916 length:2292 start_codon:yes stop_codon:yes gene_type:complete
MPAVSKKQQRFFGMVRQAQKTGQAASPEVAEVAATAKRSSVKKFASTKHKGLPEKKMKKEDYKYPLYAPYTKVDEFHANKKPLDEEGYDHWRDKQLERGTWRSASSNKPRSGGTQPKPMPKKDGKDSALEKVKADITKKYGKGAIMDVSKKTKKEEVELGEAKVDLKTPEYKRATVRDKRYGNPHGSLELGGGIRKDRRADHEAKRGVKSKGRPKNPQTVDEATPRQRRSPGLQLNGMSLIEKLRMSRKEYAKIHKDFKSDDPKKPRTTKYVPGKGTVSMPVELTDELHPNIKKIDAMSKAKVAAQSAANKKRDADRAKSAADFQAHKKSELAKGKKPHEALDSWQKKKMKKEAVEVEEGSAYGIYKGDGVDKVRNRAKKAVDHQRKGTHGDDHELDTEMKKTQKSVDKLNKVGERLRADTAAKKLEKKVKSLKKEGREFKLVEVTAKERFKRDAGAIAKKKIRQKEHNKYVNFLDVDESKISEAKVDKGRSDYGKASIRNYRRMGPGHGDPGMFDPEGKRGKTIEKRREEHKARRGVKGAKVPAYKREDVDLSEKIKYDSKGSSMDYFLGKDPKKTKYYKDQKKKKNEDCGCKHESFSEFLNEGNRTGRMLQKSKTQVTGHISADRGDDEKKNRAKRKGLEKDLKKHGIGHKKGVGEYKYDSGETGREVSYQTSKPDKMSKRRFGKVMRRLGRKHGQESVITKDKDKPAKLHTTEKGSKQKSETIGKSKAGKHPEGYGETSGTKVRSGKLPKKTNKSSYHYS